MHTDIKKKKKTYNQREEDVSTSLVFSNIEALQILWTFVLMSIVSTHKSSYHLLYMHHNQMPLARDAHVVEM
jgi:hypothetical protein